MDQRDPEGRRSLDTVILVVLAIVGVLVLVQLGITAAGEWFGNQLLEGVPVP